MTQEDEEILGLFDTVLEEREKLILSHRFGLNGVEKKTLRATAVLVGVCNGERVRQLQNVALAKLCRAWWKHNGLLPNT